MRKVIVLIIMNFFFLGFKINIHRTKDENALEIDFGAFDFGCEKPSLTSSIGNGMNFISKFMASKLSSGPECAKPLVDYLLSLNHRGEVSCFIWIDF